MCSSYDFRIVSKILAVLIINPIGHSFVAHSFLLHSIFHIILDTLLLHTDLIDVLLEDIVFCAIMMFC